MSEQKYIADCFRCKKEDSLPCAKACKKKWAELDAKHRQRMDDIILEAFGVK